MPVRDPQLQVCVVSQRAASVTVTVWKEDEQPLPACLALGRRWRTSLGMRAWELLCSSASVSVRGGVMLAVHLQLVPDADRRAVNLGGPACGWAQTSVLGQDSGGGGAGPGGPGGCAWLATWPPAPVCASSGLRSTGGTTLASRGASRMTWSSTGTLSGTMGTGAASTATTRPGAWAPPAAAAASAPTRSRWVVLWASCLPRLAGVCGELTSPVCFVF